MQTFLGDHKDVETAYIKADMKQLKFTLRTLTPLVKLSGSETTVKISRIAIQTHNGVRYTREYGTERLLRDVLVLPMYEGTTQIQALLTVKDSLLAVMRVLGHFLKQLLVNGCKCWFIVDRIERRV